MVPEKLRLTGKALAFFVPYGGRLLLRRATAVQHRWTYQATPNAKNVVVLGGSYAGVALAKRLVETLPTGYKVVLVERHSHFHYLFNFPRFAVLPGYEHTAFIPYDGLAKHAPKGIFSHVKGTAVSLTDSQVVLASGEKINYDFLALATGSMQSLPAKVVSTERDEGCRELRAVQDSIKSKDSKKIAVVGAGAVGVELATDIKTFYPDKNVTLIHSRDQVLNSLKGKRLHDYIVPVLNELGIRLLLNERPQLPPGGGVMAKGQGKPLVLNLKGGEEPFDLVIACTGQKPNSQIIATLVPGAISQETRRILVKPTLQIRTADEHDGPSSRRIFAFGDVAEHGGPRMARAGYFQAEIVLDNILSMIHNEPASSTYVPRWDFEGAIKLTLGGSHFVIYSRDSDASDILIVNKDGKLDLDITDAWKQLGVDIKSAHAPPTQSPTDVVVVT
ncbi:hypothetical protein B0T22DRAFT_424615 [Podospora appendiculata]|uniref:FAD/NAD(P)-binding domain-containing protein n=1 Tax=Podospora appendiculata TaxID=314037 RepID=A0AAE1CBK4_9PEZI|nr:hypothetical protein B0T22DRAFT_424615 [Podospora appendiculata]